MRELFFYTYIVASRSHTLYIGMTNNIERRIREHRDANSNSFAATYNCNRLVWFERYTTVHLAIAREKQLKGWKREKKLELIQKENPTWIDLSQSWGELLELPPQMSQTAGPSTPLRSAQDDKFSR